MFLTCLCIFFIYVDSNFLVYRTAAMNHEAVDIRPVNVKWTERGFLLLNLVISLCTSGMQHKSMLRIKRCENCLTGMVLMDLFRILADKEARRRGFSKGSLWLAGQTHTNVMAVAKSCLAICLSPGELGNFWAHGHGRLTEVCIEEFFGRLRTQSSSAQMTCRQYWQYSTPGDGQSEQS